MTFSRVRAPGMWLNGGAVDQTEYEKFDDQLSNALDGRHGGAYAPDAELEIGGAGFRVTGTATFDGVLQATSSALFLTAEVLETLLVHGASTFDDDVTIASGQPLTAGGNIDGRGYVGTRPTGTSAFKNQLLSDGSASFAGGAFAIDTTGRVTTNVTMLGNLEVGSSLTVTGSVTGGTAAFGDTVVAGKLTYYVNGRAQYRAAIATDADATYSINQYDIVRLPAGVTLSADRTWTIATTGAEYGMRMTLSRAGNADAHAILVVDGGGSGQIGPGLQSSSGSADAMDIFFDGTNWRLLGVSQKP